MRIIKSKHVTRQSFHQCQTFQCIMEMVRIKSLLPAFGALNEREDEEDEQEAHEQEEEEEEEVVLIKIIFKISASI